MYETSDLPESEQNIPAEQVKTHTCTVKFLNFRTPENFGLIYLKFRQKRPNLRLFCQKDANVVANSEDPDQTAPLGAV